jgi:hypothetical protein
MIRFINKLLLSLLLTGTAAMAESRDKVRDLDPWTMVKLDVVVTPFSQDNGGKSLFAKVENPYSNPMICALDISVPIRRNGNEGVYELSQGDVLIFPEGTNEAELFSRISLPGFPSHTEVALWSDTTFSKAASCRGWGLGQRLPRRTCSQLAPTYEESCIAARSAGLNYIPLIRDHLHLGDCGC